MTTTATTGTKPKLLTADDLLQLDSEGVKGELIMGVLHKRVSNGVEHGEIVLNLGSPLHQFVKSSRLGRVVGSDVGILLGRDPDTVREPDIAFISAERMPLDVREKRYSQVVPDLVVEVVAPNDRPIPLFDKAQMWLRFGAHLVWIVNPETRTIVAWPQSGSTRTYTEDDTLDGGDVLPGFTCAVRDIFEV